MTTETQLPEADCPALALPPLRRNLKFQAYWAGATAGAVGMGISNLAFPLLILAMTGSPGQAAVFSALQVGTQMALGMPSGALADRFNRRTLLITAEALRFGMIATVAVALSLGTPTMAHLFAVAVGLGAAQALGAPSRALVLRSIVPKEQLTQALSQDEARVSVAGLLGPLLAGALFAVARTAPFVLALVGFLVSLCTASAVRFDGRPAAGTGKARGGAFLGLRVLWQNRTLRAVTAVAATVNLAGAATILITVVTLQQHHSSTAVGFALAGEAVGGIIGATLISRLHTLMQPGKLLLTACWLCVPLLAGLAVPAGPIWVFALLLAVATGMPALMVMIDILVFRAVPDEVRGRVIAGTFMAFSVGTPLGSLLAGLLLDTFSPQTAVLIVCALLTVPLLAASAQRSLREAVWPAE
ncbi:MFS transporter [Kitasatospora sp. NBC_00070]|uniref:MFS transporter n=1 Tax=Kitasatospora sp. NBC_00070 TaxID=2975962 RepID=UPI003249D8AD